MFHVISFFHNQESAMRRKIAIMLVIVGTMTTSAFAQITEKDILGRWYTEEKTLVQHPFCNFPEQ